MFWLACGASALNFGLILLFFLFFFLACNLKCLAAFGQWAALNLNFVFYIFFFFVHFRLKHKHTRIITTISISFIKCTHAHVFWASTQQNRANFSIDPHNYANDDDDFSVIGSLLNTNYIH